MLTSILVKIKHSCPMLWHWVESVNSLLVRLLYPDLKEIAQSEIADLDTADDTTWSLVGPEDAEDLSVFLTSMPGEYIKWFHPHSFDAATLRRMAAGHSFLMIKVTHNGSIIGYHFLRCFFAGKSFHGLIISDKMSGRGIGTHMWHLGASICRRAGMVMQATIHRDNIASLNSCRRGCNASVIATLPDGYLLLSTHPRK